LVACRSLIRNTWREKHVPMCENNIIFLFLTVSLFVFTICIFAI